MRNRKKPAPTTSLSRSLVRALIRLRRVPDRQKIALSVALLTLTTALLLATPTTEGQITSVVHAVYAALQVAGGGGPGVPLGPGSTSDSQVLQRLLWACYFIVPGTVFAAAADLAFRTFSRPTTLTRACRNHTVILGLGNHGRVVLNEALASAVHPWEVVTVDHANSAQGIHANEKGKAWIAIKGDLLSEEVLTNAAVGQAARVFVCTGNPAVNIIVAESVASLNPGLGERLVVLADDAAAVQLVYPNRTWLLFQQFEHAARLLWKNVWTQWQQEQGPRATSSLTVSILGIGRFGRALLHQLPTSLPAGTTISALNLVDSQPIRLEPGLTLRLAHELGWRSTGSPSNRPLPIYTKHNDALEYIAALTRCPTDPHRVVLPANHLLVLAIDNDAVALRCLEWIHCAMASSARGSDTPMLVSLRLADGNVRKQSSSANLNIFPLLPAFTEQIRRHLG